MRKNFFGNQIVDLEKKEYFYKSYLFHKFNGKKKHGGLRTKKKI